MKAKMVKKSGSNKQIPQKLKNVLLPIGCAILASMYMPIFLFSVNSKEAVLAELIAPLGAFIVMSLGLLAVAYLITKSFAKASFASIALILLLENYHFIESPIQAAFPMLKYWHILPICVAAMIHIIWIVFSFIKEGAIKSAVGIIGSVMGILISLNLITAIPNILKHVSFQPALSTNDELISSDKKENDGANIYYFLLDEAASFNVLKEYYNFEAEEFRGFLLDNKFTISDSSCNDCASTEIVLKNLLNLEYIVTVGAEVDNDGVSLAGRNLFEHSGLSKFLEENDYSLWGVGNTNWLSIESITTDRVTGAATIDGLNFYQLLMNNTFLYPLFQNNISQEQQAILDAFHYYSGDVYGGKAEFKFTYIECPHQPFMFSEDGGPVPEAHRSDWSDEKYYLDQYKFVMKKIMESIDQILCNDPHSIIIVGSDHGPRFKPDMTSGKNNILNAVYFKGESLPEIEGQSSVNTLRIVLSKQFGVELPIVDVIYSNGWAPTEK